MVAQLSAVRGGACATSVKSFSSPYRDRSFENELGSACLRLSALAWGKTLMADRQFGIIMGMETAREIP